MYRTAATPELALAEQHAREIFGAALEAVDPVPAVRRALGFATIPPYTRLFIIALGKAAPAMANAAVAHLGAQALEPAGGLIVSHVNAAPPHPALESLVGDHPLPGARSVAASARLEELVRQVRPADIVWVLLSGGTSSLIGAPQSPLSAEQLAELQALLLDSGLAIGELNAVRKRFSRWGAGRLAQALEPARVRVLAISDVPDDDITAIGSGPLAPDPTTNEDVRAQLRSTGLWPHVPAGVRELLTRNDVAETPKRGDPAFRHVTTEIIASNGTAVDAAIAHAKLLGYSAGPSRTRLAGEAATAGATLARELLGAAAEQEPPEYPRSEMGDAGHAGAPICLVTGGETIVALDDAGPNAQGGRAQELVLAASRVLANHGDHRRPLVLLACGTDGRDGPTDAAGAIASPATWQAIADAGRDPARDLERHDAYRALNAAGALLRTGPTGTNVMDIAILLAR